MKKKIAFITGITGQDGSYLTQFLLKKNYVVHGIKRRTSLINTERLDHLIENKNNTKNLFIHYGDVMDANNLVQLINKIRPHEIYNLAAQSHVMTSFLTPDYTSQVNSLGTLRVLEAIRVLGLSSHTKFYQASSSEMFGNTNKSKQSEKTRFNPQSPYGVSKLYSYYITKNYRDSYGIFAANGILFNHESPRRGETFVTRKITIGLNKIALGLQKKLYLGNLYAKRDWGHAEDYVEMQWKILQQKEPDDYVIATGLTYSIKDFIHECCKFLNLSIYWSGRGINEAAYVKSFNKNKTPFLKKDLKIIEVSKKYFRPQEVNYLKGDASKARKKLKWKVKKNFHVLVKEMMSEDLNILKKKN
jgi:GDPmannose 4,6-dehydratase